LEQSH